MKFNQATLNRFLTRWQKLLRLQDWDIIIRPVHRKDLNNSSAMAECDYKYGIREAVIRVAFPGENNEDEHPYDLEQTIVHELLHIHFGLVNEGSQGLNVNDTQKWLFERAIDSLAKSFVEVDRG